MHCWEFRMVFSDKGFERCGFYVCLFLKGRITWTSAVETGYTGIYVVFVETLGALFLVYQLREFRWTKRNAMRASHVNLIPSFWKTNHHWSRTWLMLYCNLSPTSSLLHIIICFIMLTSQHDTTESGATTIKSKTLHKVGQRALVPVRTTSRVTVLTTYRWEFVDSVPRESQPKAVHLLKICLSRVLHLRDTATAGYFDFRPALTLLCWFWFTGSLVLLLPDQ